MIKRIPLEELGEESLNALNDLCNGNDLYFTASNIASTIYGRTRKDSPGEVHIHYSLRPYISKNIIEEARIARTCPMNEDNKVLCRGYRIKQPIVIPKVEGSPPAME